MAKRYQVNGATRFANRLMAILIRRGLLPGNMVLLNVRGRKSGNIISTAIIPVQVGSQRYVVAPYGEVNWVRNVRAAGQLTLQQGKHEESFKIAELAPYDAAPILKTYLADSRMVRPYFDSKPDAPLTSFEAEASNHPVFRLDAAR